MDIPLISLPVIRSDLSVAVGTDAMIGRSTLPSWANNSFRNPPAAIASTTSFIVKPNALAVAFMSASGSVALANQRCGDTTWLRKVGGALNGSARSGWVPRSLDRRRTRVNPTAASLISTGSSATCRAWSRAAAVSRSAADAVDAGFVVVTLVGRHVLEIHGAGQH